MHLCTYIYVYIHICIHTNIYIYLHALDTRVVKKEDEILGTIGSRFNLFTYL